MPAVGVGKAQRIAEFLRLLLPKDTATGAALQALLQQQLAAVLALAPAAWRHALDGSRGDNRASAVSVAPTAKAYRIEGERLLLWCVLERRKALSFMTAEDCSAYLAFLADLPAAWIRAGAPGAGSRGGRRSRGRCRQHALHITSGFFEWLVQAGYLALNPWRLVRRRLGDDAHRTELDSRAFTREAWAQLQGFIKAALPSPSRERIHFLLGFCEATGPRASGLVAARLQDLRLMDGRWASAVHGKGARNRVGACWDKRNEHCRPTWPRVATCVVGGRKALGPLARPRRASWPCTQDSAEGGLAGDVHALAGPGQRGGDARRRHVGEARLVGHGQHPGALLGAQGMRRRRANCPGPADAAGEVVRGFPALQRAHIDANLLAGLAQPCSGLVRFADVLVWMAV